MKVFWTVSVVVMLLSQCARAQEISKVLISGYPKDYIVSKEDFRKELLQIKDLQKIKDHIISKCPINPRVDVYFTFIQVSNNMDIEFDFVFDCKQKVLIRKDVEVSAGRGGDEAYPHAGMLLEDWGNELVAWSRLEVNIRKIPLDLFLYCNDTLIESTIQGSLFIWQLDMPPGKYNMKWSLKGTQKDWILEVPTDEVLHSIRQEWDYFVSVSISKPVSDRFSFFNDWLERHIGKIHKASLLRTLDLK